MAFSAWLTSQRTRYNLGVGICVALSVGGILRGAYITQKIEDGQRGGALGVAAAFLILFFRRSYGARVYRSILEKYPNLGVQIDNVAHGRPIAPFNATELTELLIGVVGRFNVEADEQKMQNYALAGASVIATIAWGFGDCAASWLQQHTPPGILAHLKALLS